MSESREVWPGRICGLDLTKYQVALMYRTRSVDNDFQLWIETVLPSPPSIWGIAGQRSLIDTQASGPNLGAVG